MIDELTLALISLNVFQLGVLFVMARKVQALETQLRFLSQQLEYSVNFKKR